MTLPALRLAIGACTIAMATVVHAATPITLPLGDLQHDATALDLPVPPPPQIARPTTAQLRLVIKRQLRPGCQAESPKSTMERRQAARPGTTVDPWARTPVWFRLG